MTVAMADEQVSDTMSDQMTGYLMTHGDTTDRYRWYLCIEKQPETWTCQRTTADAALGFTSKDRTKAIPIHSTNPPILDRLYIRAALQPTVKIVREDLK
jgi:hypothetical protein